MDTLANIIGILVIVWGVVVTLSALGQAFVVNKFSNSVDREFGDDSFGSTFRSFGRGVYITAAVIGLVLIGAGVWIFNL